VGKIACIHALVDYQHWTLHLDQNQILHAGKSCKASTQGKGDERMTTKFEWMTTEVLNKADLVEGASSGGGGGTTGRGKGGGGGGKGNRGKGRAKGGGGAGGGDQRTRRKRLTNAGRGFF
jgi:hypothetical protein